MSRETVESVEGSVRVGPFEITWSATGDRTDVSIYVGLEKVLHEWVTMTEDGPEPSR